MTLDIAKARALVARATTAGVALEWNRQPAEWLTASAATWEPGSRPDAVLRLSAWLAEHAEELLDAAEERERLRSQLGNTADEVVAWIRKELPMNRNAQELATTIENEFKTGELGPCIHEEERDAALTRASIAEAALARVSEWTHEHGAALKPKRADTYGDGMRDAKQQVGAIVSAALEGGK